MPALEPITVAARKNLLEMNSDGQTITKDSVKKVGA